MAQVPLFALLGLAVLFLLRDLNTRTGQATVGASNAIDIAIAITGFITESSMMFSWNSAAVEQFAKPLFGPEAENQLVLTARPECLRRVDLGDPDPHAVDVDRVDVDDNRRRLNGHRRTGGAMIPAFEKLQGSIPGR